LLGDVDSPPGLQHACVTCKAYSNCIKPRHMR